MKNKCLFVSAAIAALSVCAVGAAIVENQQFSELPLALSAEEKSISLTSANAPAVISSTEEMSSAEEVAIDSGNSYVTWDYYNAKKSASGHIVLSISSGVWAAKSTGYVQNHNAITGIKSLEVEFEGAGAVNIYGSNVHNGEYVFLDVLSGDDGETDSTNRIVEYQFIKIANASTESDVDIAEITFHYTCDQNNSLEKNDRLIQALSYPKNSSFAGEASTTTTAGDFSSQSFTTASEGKYFIALGFDIPKAELENYKVVYYANAADVTGFSNNHQYTRLAFKTCYENNGTFTEGTSYYAYSSPNINHETGWAKYEYTFNDMFNRDIETNMNLASGVVNALRINLSYTPTDGHFYLDQFHVERIGGSYVDNNIDIDAIEASDLTNGTLGGYGFQNNEITTDKFSPVTSKQCQYTELKQGYPCLNYPSLKADMTGKTLSFDVYATKTKYDGTEVNDYEQKIVYKFSYGGTVGDAESTNFYTTASIHLQAKTAAYYSVTSLGDNWWRITIDFDAAAAQLTPGAGSWNMGIYTQDTFNVVYLDNMFLS